MVGMGRLGTDETHASHAATHHGGVWLHEKCSEFDAALAATEEPGDVAREGDRFDRF